MSFFISSIVAFPNPKPQNKKKQLRKLAQLLDNQFVEVTGLEPATSRPPARDIQFVNLFVSFYNLLILNFLGMEN